MRPPKNFDNKMNRRKQLLPEVPQATADDYGKVVKVGETGAYELGDDENTVIVANPDVETTEILNKLTIGATTYLVNEELPITEIKAIRIIGKSMQGTDANIVLRKPIKLSNQYSGDIYSYQTGDTVSCNIETATGLQNLIDNGGNAECYIPASNFPIIIDIVFANKTNIADYNVISIGCGPYQNASFKDVEVQVSADGTNFVSVLENPDIGYAYEAYREVGKMYEVVPEIPTPTIADAGKVLGVDSNGAWELDNIPSELPTVTSADAGKVLGVDSNGDWELRTINEPIMCYLSGITQTSGTYKANVGWRDMSGNTIDISNITKTVPMLVKIFGFPFPDGSDNCRFRTFYEYGSNTDIARSFFGDWFSITGNKLSIKSVSINSTLTELTFTIN